MVTAGVARMSSMEGQTFISIFAGLENEIKIKIKTADDQAVICMLAASSQFLNSTVLF